MTPLVEGQPLPALSALMRGLVYGDGVFRTLSVRRGHVVAAERQWSILAEDAARLRMAVAPLNTWMDDSLRALEASPEAGVLRWIAVRATDGRGYGSTTAQTLRVVDAARAPPPPSGPMRCVFGDQVLPIVTELAGIKHLNRLPQVLASRDWPAAVDETLLCDAGGHLACGSRSSLFWVVADRLLTPTMTAGVDGFVRRWLRAQAPLLGLSWTEVAAPPSVLQHADEVLIGNSVMGIQPVASLGHWTFPAPGPVCRLLQAAYEGLR